MREAVEEGYELLVRDWLNLWLQVFWHEFWKALVARETLVVHRLRDLIWAVSDSYGQLSWILVHRQTHMKQNRNCPFQTAPIKHIYYPQKRHVTAFMQLARFGYHLHIPRL